MSDLPISARVGANVRRLRTGHELALWELGDRLRPLGMDLSVSGLSRLEQGQRPITVDQLMALAEVLDVAPADLLEQETVVTGTGNLSMRLEATPALGIPIVAETVASPEPAGEPSVIDPALLRAVAQLAQAAELRGLRELLASTTVTPATVLAVRAIVAEAAGSGDVADAIIPLVTAAHRDAQRGA